MSPDLDLEHGDEDAAEKILSSSAPSRAKRTTSSTSKTAGAAKSKTVTDADNKALYGRLVAAFHDLSEQAAAREDNELADILERRKESMAQGLVSLTRNVLFLRGPLVLLINFLEPSLAFWELGGLAIRRYIARQQRIRYERQERNGVPVVDGNVS